MGRSQTSWGGVIGTIWGGVFGTIWTTAGQCEMQWDDVEQIDVGMKCTSEKGSGYDDLGCC